MTLIPVYLGDGKGWVELNALLYDDFLTDEGLSDLDKEETFEDHTLNNQIDASVDWTEVGPNAPDIQIRTGGVSASQCARQITQLYGAYTWDEPGWVNADSLRITAAFQAGLIGDITPLNWGILFNWDPNAGVDYGEGYRIVVEDNALYFVSYTAGVESAAIDGQSSVLALNNSTIYGLTVTYSQSTGSMEAEVYEWASGPGTGTQVSCTDSTYTAGKIGVQIYCFDQFMWVDSFSFDSVNQRVGIASPRTCEPGPGTLTIVDSLPNSVISGSNLLWTENAANADPNIWGTWTQAARVAGVGVYCNVRKALASAYRLVMDANHDTSPNQNYSWFNSGATTVLNHVDNNVAIAGSITPSNDVYVKSLIVARPLGAFFITDGKLNQVADVEASVNDVIGVHCRNDASDIRIEEVAAVPLASYNSAWAGDWTEVTDSKSTPASGTAFDCEADFHMNVSVTIEDTKWENFFARYTDSANWFKFSTASDREIYIQNKTTASGTETLYNSGKLTDGVTYEFDFIAVGSNYWLFKDKVLEDSGTVTDDGNNLVEGGLIQHTLVTNDIEITTHPYPSLGIATSRVVCPQNEDTWTMTADAIFEMKNVTLPSSSDARPYLRRVDADNAVWLRLYDTGQLVLYDLVGGSSTQKFSAGSGSVSDGDDIVVVLDGASAEAFVNGASVESTSAISTTTGTSGLLERINGFVCDHIACYPRDLTSLLPSELI